MSKPKQTTFEMVEPPRFISVAGKQGNLTAVDTSGRIWVARGDGSWNWRTKRNALLWELCDTWTIKNGETERYEEES